MAAPPVSRTTASLLTPSAAPCRDEQNLRSAVSQILSDPIFHRSPRLCQLLEYIAEQSLRADFKSLKEPAIGQRVFGRPANYNAADDNIVRSNIRQLRLKLDEYYARRGDAGSLRLAIPKGSYTLCVVPGGDHAGPIAPSATRRNTVRRALVMVAVLVGVAVVAFLAGRQSATGSRASSPPNTILSLLNPAPGQRLLVVAPDAGVQLYQRLTGRPVSLPDYIDRQFLTPAGLRDLPAAMANRANDLFNAARTQSFVLGLIPNFAQAVPPGELSVRHPDTLAAKDFERDNAVLISGPWGDPWVQLFDRTLNFQVEVDLATQRTSIVNLDPRPTERRYYTNFTDHSKTVVCYARIAYLPGLSPSSRVILAGGPHTVSTEAASLFLTQPNSLETVLRLFHAATPQALPWFELLVEARAIGNSPWTMKILASRVVAPKNR